MSFSNGACSPQARHKTERPGNKPGLPDTLYTLLLNRLSMRRRRHTPTSHTRSSYCVFASLTRHYSNIPLVPRQSPILGTTERRRIPRNFSFEFSVRIVPILFSGTTNRQFKPHAASAGA